jgi:hypothetical protein
LPVTFVATNQRKLNLSLSVKKLKEERRKIEGKGKRERKGTF